MNRTKNIDNLMTAEQVAAFLGVSVATVWRLTSSKKLTKSRVLGRTVFERAKVEAVHKQRQRSAAAAG